MAVVSASHFCPKPVTRRCLLREVLLEKMRSLVDTGCCFVLLSLGGPIIMDWMCSRPSASTGVQSFSSPSVAWLGLLLIPDEHFLGRRHSHMIERPNANSSSANPREREERCEQRIQLTGSESGRKHALSRPGLQLGLCIDFVPTHAPQHSTSIKQFVVPRCQKILSATNVLNRPSQILLVPMFVRLVANNQHLSSRMRAALEIRDRTYRCKVGGTCDSKRSD